MGNRMYNTIISLHKVSGGYFNNRYKEAKKLIQSYCPNARFNEDEFDFQTWQIDISEFSRMIDAISHDKRPDDFKVFSDYTKKQLLSILRQIFNEQVSNTKFLEFPSTIILEWM